MARLKAVAARNDTVRIGAIRSLGAMIAFDVAGDPAAAAVEAGARAGAGGRAGRAFLRHRGADDPPARPAHHRGCDARRRLGMLEAALLLPAVA
ncbi:MAG: hypothetical protein WDN24_11975 [Sphingomonas sp.]